ncbi:hypothetical protein [Pseudactinotalea sp.]|uniref:hypothetical protein n=1 Tax=Pseudactinotalea sp. TaxID=1926260 RepID=UPI003B3A5031
MPPSTEHPSGEGGHDESSEGDGPRHPTQDDFDRRFAELTSHPDLDGLQQSLPRPDPARPQPNTGEPDSETGDAPPSGTLGGPRDYAPPEDELDEHFDPPEPESLTSADPIKVLAWTGAIAGPVCLMLVVIFWTTAPAIVWLTVLAVTLLGWVVAILRLPRSRNDDDDGAVV